MQASFPDLYKFVVIVRRGTCPFVTKLTDVVAKGAKTTLIYDNGNGFAGLSVGKFNAALIQAADGEFLIQQFAAGAPITISFPQTGGSVNFPDAKGGLISLFTSYGPSNEFYSTLPTTQGFFGVESGTSMATPFVAGSILFSVKGKSASVGKTSRTLFETTAQRVSSSHMDGDPLQTVSQLGMFLMLFMRRWSFRLVRCWERSSGCVHLVLGRHFDRPPLWASLLDNAIVSPHQNLHRKYVYLISSI